MDEHMFLTGTEEALCVRYFFAMASSDENVTLLENLNLACQGHIEDNSYSSHNVRQMFTTLEPPLQGQNVPLYIFYT